MFLDSLLEVLTDINNFVWGPVMLALLLGTGFYLTLGLRFVSITWIPRAIKFMWLGRYIRKDETGEVSAYNAFMTALAGTVGTGNIIGVSTAVFLGGPGAIFWMWMTALVGMATKYAETVLALEYREITEQGSYVGGPMYFIKNGLGKKWTWLGYAFAIFTIIASFGIGNMLQSNATASILYDNFEFPTWITGIILFLFSSFVLIGGVKRIAEVSGKFVPIMASYYSFMCIVILFAKGSEIPNAFMLIINDAFSPTAAQGGFAGATIMMAIRFGVARGLFSNEAGLGSACIVYAVAATSSSVRMGLIGMLGTFIDTIIICTLTGLVLIVTGAWTSGLNGANLINFAFNSVIPYGHFIVIVSIVLFTVTTTFGWCVYGERCVIFLVGEKFVPVFRVIFCLMIPLGAITSFDLVWLLTDTFNALMAIPNLIGIILLSPVLFKVTKEYVQANK